MPNVFISYRRDDAEAEARLLANALKERFGDENVFFDRVGIVPGARYPDVLRDRLGSSDVLIAVIGRDWIKSREGVRRLDEDGDWVTHELAISLRRQIRVVPVLVKGASPPSETDLPAQLKDFALCQALSARGESWDGDVSRLIEQLDPLSGKSRSFASSTSGLTPYAPEEWRDALKPLLQKVKTVYIDGVLASAQRESRFIRVEREDVPHVLKHTSERMVEITDKPSQTIHQNVPLIHTYDRVAASLLILGEPGCGKTTAMLELARDLILRAEGNTGAPVPVVFRLSSWGQGAGDFFSWLLGELQVRYHVPRRIGRMLLERQRLVFLLDGLDEVGSHSQARCVNAINDYLERFGLAGVVLTCRYREYTLIPARLHLFGAIFIRSLSHADVVAYLEAEGTDLAQLRSAVKSDETLMSVAQVPFFLLLMTVAFRHLKSDPAVPATQLSTQELKSAICDRYIRARLASTTPFPWATDAYMSMMVWLARAMRRTGQTECHIEYLQPTWLTKSECFAWFVLSRLATFIAFAASMILIELAFWAVVADPTERRRHVDFFLSNLAPSIALGLGTAVYVGILGYAGILAPKNRWAKRIFVAIGVSFVYVLLYSLTTMVSWSRGGSLYGPLFVALYVLRMLRPKLQDEVAAAERLGWSWRSALRRGSIAFGVGGVLCTLLAIEMSQPQYTSARAGLDFGTTLVVAVMAGLFVNIVFLTLTTLVFSGVTTSIASGKVRPNEGILLSVRNAFLAWFLALVWFLFIAYAYSAGEAFLGTGQSLPRMGSLSYISVFLGPTVTFIAFNLGGVDVVHHYMLRFLLAIKGYVPFKLPGFLDAGVQIGFLRRVGGGYTFLHRIFLDHLATLPSPTHVRDRSA